MDWSGLRQRDAQAAVSENPPDYRRHHANLAASYLSAAPDKVLIVGCNHGEECPVFVDMGAGLVTGIDIHDETGRDFQHARVRYQRAGVESIPLAEATFDLVYAHAVMEHVHQLEAGFAEMVRVNKPGGIIYSVASPLWHCRQGPHWGEAYDHDPWPHLRYSTEQLVALASGRAGQYYRPEQIRYCMSDVPFNKRRARDYLNACMCLDGIEIVRNDMDFDKFTAPAMVLRELVKLGYDWFDLFGFTHTFVARKL